MCNGKDQLVVAVREQDGVTNAEELILPAIVSPEDRVSVEELARRRAVEIRERMAEDHPEAKDVLLIYSNPKDPAVLGAIVGFAESGPRPAYLQLEQWQAEQDKLAETKEGGV